MQVLSFLIVLVFENYSTTIYTHLSNLIWLLVKQNRCYLYIRLSYIIMVLDSEEKNVSVFVWCIFFQFFTLILENKISCRLFAMEFASIPNDMSLILPNPVIHFEKVRKTRKSQTFSKFQKCYFTSRTKLIFYGIFSHFS